MLILNKSFFRRVDPKALPVGRISVDAVGFVNSALAKIGRGAPSLMVAADALKAFEEFSQ